METTSPRSFLARHWPKLLLAVAAVLIAVPLVVSPRVDRDKVPTGATVPAPSDTSGRVSPVVAAAGDIACEPGSDDLKAAVEGRADVCRAELTARVVEQIDPVAVLALGDLQYEDASLDKFRSGYDATWGRFKSRTRPVPGNHEYDTDPSGYFTYFGAAAGDPSEGWYSFDVGGWHLIALNSNCGSIGGCGEGSAQMRWLSADLAAHASAKCTLAYMHDAYLSSGENGPTKAVVPLWEELARKGVDVVLAGHDHDYERFAPVNAEGERDDLDGMRQFVVGTGGRNHYALPDEAPLREAGSGTTYGVLELTLGFGSYDWDFVPVAGGSYTDTGRAACR